ncbi:aspartyl-phosphate phosphatase Spo0E family protein [Aneurinibacillus sp. Ricciae_BoGa-3]|uniref:aspartyl-phosphate phosphatase Spo0E family protein n=1 Tax=Aneurinibacillus sp. Ricciae_BoGa-3 TaxID=3022697 RepID=UPI002341C182|nr:aspartyl-phosphate phosphatase Spo0E family protein [Aneurinibacillus sp. Ricciae_BoGa-3]WCK56285.1 aspartyl-phosphate phosphatase Spo0E family protein [Aneurinibacillus sp. Ricciae_BoGa-3]
MDCSVDAQISELKRLMTSTAEKYNFNFLHPDVIEISQKLDVLIVQAIKEKHPVHRGKDASSICKHITKLSVFLFLSIWQSRRLLPYLYLHWNVSSSGFHTIRTVSWTLVS